MTSEHPNDPLDYLYEELPPERMAEARAHLSECPVCREEMRKIRETVKTYRQTDAPAPPAGLAARTAALALEMARAATPPETGDSRPDNNLAVAAEASDPAQEAEFARLKQELLGEMRTGWRTWFFHPAWAVAAAVTFICSVLIHVSPRGNLWFDETRAAPVMAEQSAHMRMQEPAPVPLPEPKRELRSKQAVAYAPAPPVLREAEATQETPVPRQEPPPGPAASAAPAAAPVASAARERAQAVDDIAPDSDSTGTEAMDLAAAPSGALRPAPRAQAPSATIAPPVPEVPEAALEAAAEMSQETVEKDMAESAASSLGDLRPPPPSASAVAEAVPSPADPSLAAVDTAPGQQDLSGLVSLRKNGVVTQGGTVNSRYFYRDGKTEAKKAQPEAPQENEAAKERAAEPVIVNEFDFREPPQLIARPTPIDVVKLTRDLSTLAGMQIGSGEIADAWITIGMLRRYDPKKADELAAILEEMEKAAEARAVAEEAERAGQADEPPAAGPRPDKYYTPEAPAPVAPPPSVPAAPAVPVAEPPAASAAEPIAALEAAAAEEPVAEASSASPPSVPESTFAVEPIALDAPLAAPVAGPGAPQYYIGPVYSEDETPPPLPRTRAASAAPAVSAPVAVAEPAPPAERDDLVADAPTVPKASEDAVPPTLWESGRFDSSRRIGPPRDERSLPAWRRTFSTDPYYRDE